MRNSPSRYSMSDAAASSLAAAAFFPCSITSSAAAPALDIHGEADASQLARTFPPGGETCPIRFFHRPRHHGGEIARVVAALHRRLVGHRRRRNEVAPPQLVGREAELARGGIDNA